MSRISFFLCIFIASAIFILPAFLIIRNFQDEEFSIYTSISQMLSDQAKTENYFFVSHISTCGLEFMPQSALFDEWLSALILANRAPRRNMRLIQQASDLTAFSQLKPDEYAASTIFKLSRVAFNQQRNKAIICVETDTEGTFYLFSKQHFAAWQLIQRQVTWMHSSI
ncbi:MAG: hypothetical protein KUG79_06670 [Pseudomonadales bacterium]|nr:hypothetical protein [Pseudomonadales bacterium]